MGLKWFRARLSMEKEAAKVPELTGLYRRMSDFESTPKFGKIMKYSTNSDITFPIVNDSMINDNNRTVERDLSEADCTSQSSSSIINSEESMTKDSDKKIQINNHEIENVEPSTSTKNSTIKEQLISGEELKKITNDQNYISDTKNPVSSDNELVI
ncbi:hypothetical protein PUN28_015383 [Cardiocondyla obscurior]|uniref:Uncharacterized protein n=1 Tax=Cardiocondyla obscurior TaxID=286306 RepID=A0AAW2EVA6_9HYME